MFMLLSFTALELAIHLFQVHELRSVVHHAQSWKDVTEVEVEHEGAIEGGQVLLRIEEVIRDFVFYVGMSWLVRKQG